MSMLFSVEIRREGRSLRNGWMKIQYDLKLNTRKGRWRRRYRFMAYMTRRTPWSAKIVIDLGRINRDRIKKHHSMKWMLEQLLRTIDHETAHVFQERFYENVEDEEEALRFERAGSWVRRA